MTDWSERQGSGERRYLIKDGGNPSKPNYARTMAGLSTKDLRAEVKLGKGDANWLKACRVELDLRSRKR